MKKMNAVLFVLYVGRICGAASSGKSPHGSPGQSPKMRVEQATKQTHHFMPTKRYFEYADSLVRCFGGDTLVIFGVASSDSTVVKNLKRAAHLVPLDLSKPAEHNLNVTASLFEEIVHRSSSCFKYHIALALIQKKNVQIGHAYTMHMPNPVIKSECFEVKALNPEDIMVPLKVIGKKAELSSFIVSLLSKDAHSDAQTFLNAQDQLSLHVGVGGVLHLRMPACLAMLQQCRPRSDSIGARLGQTHLK